MRIARFIGRAVAVVVGLVVVAAAGLYARSEWIFRQKVAPPERAALVVTKDSVTLALGRRLTVAYGCQDCHSESLGGKVMADDPMFGRLVASNLTAGSGGALSHYDDRALDAAIRDGVGWDGRKLAIMPSNEFSGLSDADIAVIIANIRERAPVNNVLKPMWFGPIARGLVAGGALKYPYDQIDHARVTMLVSPSGGNVAQGRYIAAGCVGCHGADYGGAPVPGAPPGSAPSPDITPSGRIAQWTQAEFVRVLREGVRPDGSKVSPMMPWQALSQLSDDELQGLYLYLKTLAPKTSVTKAGPRA